METGVVAPTCTEAGHHSYWTCQRCNDIFSDSEGKNKIDNLEQWLSPQGGGYIAPTGHSWGE